MKIVKCEVGKKAVITDIGENLKDMQNVVGGYIEAVYPFKENVVLVCNDEGKFNGMKANRTLYGENKEIVDVIYGDFFIVGCTREDFVSLTDDQADFYAKKFETPEKILTLAGRPTMVPCLEF